MNAVQSLSSSLLTVFEGRSPSMRPDDAFEACRFGLTYGASALDAVSLLFASTHPRVQNTHDVHDHDAVSSSVFASNGVTIAPVDPAALAARHAGAVEAWRLAVGDENIFQNYLLPSIFAWGAAVQGLPAAAEGPYAEADGLFLFGLHAAEAAAREAQKQMPERSLAPIERKCLEERFFAAAMLLAMIRTALVLSSVTVVAGRTEDDSMTFQSLRRFDPATTSLFDFALDAAKAFKGQAILRIRRRRMSRSNGFVERAADGSNLEASEADAGLLLAGIFSRVISRGTLSWLDESVGIRSALMACVRGTLPRSTLSAALDAAASAGLAAAIQKRARETAERDGRTPSIRAWGPLLVFAMQSCVQSGRWLVNQLVNTGIEQPEASGRSGLSLFYGQDGLYLPWPDALFSAADCIAETDAAPLLEDSDLAAAVLLEMGFVVPDETGRPVMRIAVPKDLSTAEQSQRHETGAGDSSSSVIWRDALRVADPDGLLRLAAHAAQAKHPIAAGVRSGTQARGRAAVLLNEAAAFMPGLAPGTSLQRNPYVPEPCPVVFRPDVSDASADASVRSEKQAQAEKAKTVRNKANYIANKKARVAKAASLPSGRESWGSAFKTQQHPDALDGFRESLLALRARRKDGHASEDACSEHRSTAGISAELNENKTGRALPEAMPTVKNDCERTEARFYWHFDWSAVSLSRRTAACLRQALRRINDVSEPEKFAVAGALFVPLAFFRSSENPGIGADAVATELKAARCLAGIEAVLERLEAEQQIAVEKDGEFPESKEGSGQSESTSSDSNPGYAPLLHAARKRRRKPLPAELLGECIRALPLDEARSVLSAPLPNAGSTGAPWGVLLDGRLLQPKLRSKKGRLISAPLLQTGMLPVGFTGPDWGDLARISAAVLRRAAGVRPPRVARTPSQEGHNR